MGKGSKIDQRVSVPTWIKENDEYKVYCLRGLLETDGTIYSDRGYPMVMFTSAIPKLANEVYQMILSFNFVPHLYKITQNRNGHTIYRVRLSKKVSEFLVLVRPEKF